MNRALVLALCAGLAMAPAAASGSETYRLCGPGAAGFIRSGKALACIGASVDWRKQPGAGRTATAASPMAAKDFQALLGKHVQKERSLVANDCGRPPEERDYGIGPWKPKNQLGQTVYGKDMAAWQQCADRVMASKFSKEKEAMEREAVSAGRRAGLF